MSTLHWICALTLALVCCLNAQPVKRSDHMINDLLDTIDKLTNTTKCHNDTELYSPSNIREDCLPSALICTLEELNTFEAECKPEDNEEDFEELFENLLTGLTNWEHKKFSTNPSSNCTCELYKETDEKIFLKNIKALMHQLLVSEG